MDELVVSLRDFNEEQDKAYVYASWRNNSYYSAFKKPEIKPSDYFSWKTKKIKSIILLADIKVACFQDTPEVIVGYSVSLNKHLYWILVKADYRGKGIGKMLFPKDIETVSDELTKIGK